MRILPATTLLCLAALTAAFGEPRGVHAQRKTAPGHQQRQAQDTQISDLFLPGAPATREQFLRRVKASSRATRCYAEYLHLPQVQVVDALSDGFTHSALDVAGSFTEYRRHSNGVIYPVHIELARGTQIIKAMRGKVSLIASNGDPIIPYTTVVNYVLLPSPPTPQQAPPVEVIVTAPEREVVHQGEQASPASDTTPQ